MPSSNSLQNSHFKYTNISTTKRPIAQYKHYEVWKALKHATREKDHLDSYSAYATKREIKIASKEGIFRHIISYVRITSEQRTQANKLFAQGIFYGGLPFTIFNSNPYFQ
jgi:hypothetical protein